MGRGLLPDDHGSCVNAARSLAIGGADVALVVGARLNWQLHFGEPPKWSPGVKFIMTDVELGARDAGKAQVGEERQHGSHARLTRLTTADCVASIGSYACVWVMHMIMYMLQCADVCGHCSSVSPVTCGCFGAS